MDLQEIITNAVKAQRAEEMKTSPQLTVGELILKLEAVERTYESYDKKIEKKEVQFDFANLRPTNLDSWRGSYAELAFGFSEEYPRPSVEEVIGWLKEAIGKEYTGYKGGEFVMGKSTPLWVANYGNSGSTGIVGIKDSKYSVILEVANLEGD